MSKVYDASASGASELLSSGLSYLRSLKDDLTSSLGGIGLKAAGSSSKRAVKDIVSSSSAHSAIVQHDYSLLKKLVSLGIASAAVFGSAFYIGYQLARRRHRFHVREADKHDQVRFY